MQSAGYRELGLAAAAFLLMSTTIGAQGQPAAPARTSRIGVIDIERVSTESLLGKEYATRLGALQASMRSEGTRRQQELQKMDEDIKVQRERLIQDQPILGTDAVDERQQQLDRLTRQRESYRQDSEALLGQLQRKGQKEADELQTDLRRKIGPALQELVKDKGLDVILDVRVCVASSNDVDVTGELIRRIDAAFRAGTLKPAADKPAAPAPAAPGAKAQPPAK
jgi:Skp family chaperone for outer membrane proteins